jgi:hypothetical protein
MKISATKLFDKSLIQDEKVLDAITPLIDYVNSISDQLITLSQNKINFTDNVASEIKSVSLKHNTALGFALSRKPIGITPIRTFGDSITAFTWYFSSTGEVIIKANFLAAASTSVQVNILAIYD